MAYNSGGFGTCQKCRARILWIRTVKGKKMPCDSSFVYYKEKEGGKDRIVLPNGEVVAGEIQDTQDGATGYGYVSHFATCTGFGTKKRSGTKGISRGEKNLAKP